MKYEFGVMSKRFSLKAKNDFIAHICMCLFIKKPIPIAIYKPRKHTINPMEILDTDNELTKEQKLEISKCMESIQDLEMSLK